MNKFNPNAFPTRSEHEDSQRPDVSGMSLRDYFAAKAMQAHWSNPDVESYEQTAHQAYELADAMLNELNKRKEQL